MEFKCVIVDDEELARRLLLNHLSNLDNFEVVAACESAIEANKVLKEQHVDLLFLDVEMPVLKGMDFFKNLTKKPKVIFTTAYRDYAVEGFELDAVDYLLKPISFARFFKSIEKFEALQSPIAVTQELTRKTDTDFLFIREDRKQVKVWFDEIIYIQSLKDYIQIHTVNKKHIIKHSITSFYELLDKRFLRTHRSFIVNSDKITAFTAEDIELDGQEIPIGESFKKLVSKYLMCSQAKFD